MKSPWVSRAHLEAVEREAAQWKAAYERERDRYEAAMTALLAEKSYARDTGKLDLTAPKPTFTVARSEPTFEMTIRKPDPLAILIDEVCGTNLRKRAMMLRQLSADRAAKIPDEQIEESIRNGIAVDGVPS